MTVVSPPSLHAFDEQARADVRGLVETNRAREALDRLARYEPRTREERIHFYGLRARAFGQLGDLAQAVREWVRALHLTSRHRELRPRVRICLADTLSFAGDPARAERIVQRCVAEIRAQGGAHPLEPWALSSLAYLHLVRGGLSLAVRLYENALALLGDGTADPVAWASLTTNYSLALMRWGEHARAKQVLSKVAGSRGEASLPNAAPLLLTRALLAMDSGDLDGAERALAEVGDTVLGDDSRARSIHVQIEAALHVAQGRPGRALDLVARSLDGADARASTAPGHVELLRLRALALLGLERNDEALESAREALQACGGADRLDRPAVLRVMAKCLAALGRREEAKASLATALSLLESTEFIVERGRLYSDMEALGMSLPGVHRARRSPPRRDEAGGRVHSFELADGRRFLTSDDDLVERVRRAAESRLPVLLEGETGTGKELVARLLHELGNAREGPFVVVDCTTLSESLAEAELFGVARGAYTGAATGRSGLVGAADGGTLLFDELPELSLPVQSKLLRLLQEGTYRRLGEARPRSVSVRVIASTNQDSERLLAGGALKPDLFFRLHGYRIRLRPLRDRVEDIPVLAEEFARAQNLRGVAPEALAELRSYSWPGNARQLEMLIRVAAAGLGAGGWIEKALVTRLLEETPSVATPSAERQRLRAALDAHSGNVAATARALGMSRQGLYKALHRNGLM